MAKSKMKLDSKALQAWLNLHVEKLALGVCAVIFLWMAYSSWNVTQAAYKKTPSDLLNSVRTGEGRIADAHKDWNRQEDGIVLPNPPYADQVSVALKELDPAPFKWAMLPNRPLHEDRSRRGEPKYLPAIELESKFVQGAVQGEKAGTVLGHTWVVLTAAIPLEQQIAEFDKVFKGAILPFDLTRDRPTYVDFVVQRAEVVNGAIGEWKDLDLNAANTLDGTFNPQRSEIVDPQQFAKIDPFLNNIPPQIEPPIDARYAHPKIPPAAEGPKKQEAPKEQANAGVRPPRGQAVAAVAPPPEPAANAAPQAAPKFILFRYCDFSAQRKVPYQYRVKLVLRNSNFNVPGMYLAKPEFAKGEKRETPWSEPSPTVTIPHDFEIAAVDVRAASSSVPEALAKFMTVRFADRFGVVTGFTHGDIASSSTKKSYERGTRIHFNGLTGKVRTAGSNTMAEGQVDYPFNSVLVGIAGGGEPSAGPIGSTTNTRRNQKSPGEILVLWPDGHLDIRGQGTDGPLVDSIVNPKVEVAAAAVGDAGAQAMPAANAADKKAPAKGTTLPKTEPGKEAPKGKLEDFLKGPTKK